jgi:hypothetical protein
LRITEADYEYLLHTLSEARSRATEIAASLSGRVGREHPLAQLANAAALNVERVLRGVQRNASEPLEAVPKVFEISSGAPTVAAAPPASPPNAMQELPWASFSRETGVGPEHWVSQFVDDLMLQVRASGAITFDTAGRLLEQHRQSFERDLAITRRMVRNYPHFFTEELEGGGGAPRHNVRRTFIAKA